MTDEPGTTYEALLAMNEELKEKLAFRMSENERLRKTSDDNYNNGQAWKNQADTLTKQLDRANNEASSARAEAAELRGYIRRVNELDPKQVRASRRRIREDLSRDVSRKVLGY